MSEATSDQDPPISDEDLQAITVGDLTIHAAPILLAPYDPAWPALFEREAERIRMRPR